MTAPTYRDVTPLLDHVADLRRRGGGGHADPLIAGSKLDELLDVGDPRHSPAPAVDRAPARPQHRGAFIAGWLAARDYYGAVVDGVEHGAECWTVRNPSNVCDCDRDGEHDTARRAAVEHAPGPADPPPPEVVEALEAAATGRTAAGVAWQSVARALAGEVARLTGEGDR